MDCVIAPVDHMKDTPLFAVSVAEPPGQNDVDPDTKTLGVGKGLTTTVVVIVDEQAPVEPVIV